MLTTLKGLKVKVGALVKHFRAAKMRKLCEVDNTYPINAVPLPSLSCLNPLQSYFQETYDSEKNCVVESSVGTGMTSVAYLAVRRSFERCERVILTAPSRALVKASVGIREQRRRT